MILMSLGSWAQNPVIRDQFSADPSARISNGKVYLYASHDILAKPGQGRPNWFCMEDYHLFSSSNLTDWTDHGVILSQNRVNWVDTATYSMWAPDCIEKNGKYYFYFPSKPEPAFGKGYSVGVAVADKPDGPFIPQPEPLKSVSGIDPNPFIDKDGQAYLYWSMGNIYAARLKENMIELASDPQIVAEMPKEGLKEGPWLFERNGIYYMTYPHVQNKIERLEYATGDNPLGPFKFAGVIMDELPSGCWTNHQSIIEYHKQWYLFYHDNSFSPRFDKARSVCIDSLFFNGDGTIRKVTPTLRGVGVTPASEKIEIDRFSYKSPTGTSVAFMDTANTFLGWKTLLESPGAWIQYNSIDFGHRKLKSVVINAKSATGGTLQIRLDNLEGAVLAQVNIPAGLNRKKVQTRLSEYHKGIHNLAVVLENGKHAEIDWISFK